MVYIYIYVYIYVYMHYMYTFLTSKSSIDCVALGVLKTASKPDLQNEKNHLEIPVPQPKVGRFLEEP